MKHKPNDLYTAIQEFVDQVKELAPDHAVSFELFFSDSETKFELSTRTPEQLKHGGYSMKNLKGVFIK
jgi:hypothetical protein